MWASASLRRVEMLTGLPPKPQNVGQRKTHPWGPKPCIVICSPNLNEFFNVEMRALALSDFREDTNLHNSGSSFQ